MVVEAGKSAVSSGASASGAGGAHASGGVTGMAGNDVAVTTGDAGATSSGAPGPCGYVAGGPACFVDPPPFDRKTYFYRCVMFGPGPPSLSLSCGGASCHGWGGCNAYDGMLKYVTKNPAESPLLTYPSSGQHGGPGWADPDLAPLLAATKRWLAQESQALP